MQKVQSMQLSSKGKCFFREVLNLKIHGRYCGPNWTHGRRIPASDYNKYDEVTPIDRLDRACQAHDEDCSKGGCSKKGDTALIRRVFLVAGTTSDPRLRATALAVAAGISAALLTRSR